MLGLRRRTGSVLLAAWLFGIASACVAAPASECEQVAARRAQAVRSQEALPIEQAARQFLDACREGQPKAAIAMAMEELAASKRLSGRFSEALRASNACLDYHYEAVGCHAEKALALASLRLLTEARDVIESGRVAGARELERAKREMDGSGMRRHERAQEDAEQRIRLAMFRERLAKRGLERLAAVSGLLSKAGEQ